MSDSSADRNQVDRLAEEFAERYRRGERPSLTEYVEKYPQYAAEIRDLFPALVLMEQLKPDAEKTGPYVAPTASQVPERLGEYRILREVGRGGMGVVYEAEQESLGRRVALKVLPGHALLDPQRLERFRREAKAAAKLHHTNIVPVFGVGEADGLHYYAMQFITGQGLDQVLVEVRRARQGVTSGNAPPLGPTVELSAAGVAQSLLSGHFSAAPPVPDAPPSAGSSATAVQLPGGTEPGVSSSGRAYWQSVARIGVQVADALAYAHGHGILHRDIKPANLLLDLQGTVWVADFGLAKDAGGDDLTGVGDVVGTLRYMAPERFEGRSDARSDLYALGLTLYELLVLRPAFDATGREALIADVMHGEPQRPSAVNRQVPCDLETVVLKAIARDPAARYQSAQELAADLQRFVEDRPILARRSTATERLARWARRNPVVAALTGTSAVLLVALVVALTAAVVNYSSLATTEAQATKDIAEEKRRLVDERDQVREANRLLDVAARHQVNKEWAKALAACDAAVAIQPDNGAVRTARAQLLLRLGLVDEAAPDFAKLFEIHPPSDPSKWFAYACLLLNKGEVDPYRALCRAMLEQFPDPSSPELARWVVATCTLAPGAVEDPEALVRLVEKVTDRSEGQNLTVERWAALYRAGRYTEALAEVANSPPPYTTRRNLLFALFQHAAKVPGEYDKRNLESAQAALDNQARILAQQPLTDDPAEQILGIYPTPTTDDERAGWLADLLLYREAVAVVLADADADAPLPHVIRARACAVLGRASEARAEVDRAVALRPESAYFYLDRARVLALLGDWPEAEKDLAGAVAHLKPLPPPAKVGMPPPPPLEPASFDVPNQAGQLCAHYRHWEAAETYLLLAKKVLPPLDATFGPVLHRLLAQTYVARKNWDAAAATYVDAFRGLAAIATLSNGSPGTGGGLIGDGFGPRTGFGQARPPDLLQLSRALEQEIAGQKEVFDRIARPGQDDNLWLARVRLLMRDGDTDGATAVFIRALRPTNQPPMPRTGPLRLTGAEPIVVELVRWEAIFDKVVATRPGEPELWLARCRFLLQGGHWDAAADAWHKAIAAAPPPVVMSGNAVFSPYLNSAYDLVVWNDELFRRVRAPATDDPELWLKRARILIQRNENEHDEADAAFQRAAQLKPNDLTVWRERARHRLQQGKPAEARGIYEELLRLRPTDNSALALATQELTQGGRAADAADLCDAAIKAAPKDPERLLTRARLLTAQKRWEDATKDYKAALDLLPAEVPPNPRGGSSPPDRRSVYWMIVSDEQARQQIFQAIADSRPKNDAQPWLARGYWLLQQNNGTIAQSKRLAAADFQKAVECEPKNGPAWNALADAATADSQWDVAADAFLKVLDIYPQGNVPGRNGQLRTVIARLDNVFQRVGEKRLNDDWLWWERANFLAQSNRFGEAEIAFDRLAKDVAPKMPRAWILRANFLITRKEWDKAADSFVKAVELIPQGDEARNFDWIFLEVARTTEIHERLVAKYPKDARFLTARAMLLANSGAPVKDFEAAFTKALELHPNDPATLLARARAYAGRALWKQAAADYAASHKARDFSDESLVSMEYAAVQLAGGDGAGYRATAARMFDRFEDPNDPVDGQRTALVCLLLPDGGGDPNTLLVLAQKAERVNPTALCNAYTTALVHCRAGRFGPAATGLQEVLKRFNQQPNQPDIVMVMLVRALAQARLGQVKDAQATVQITSQALTAALPSDAAATRVLGDAYVWAMCIALSREVKELLAAQDKANEGQRD